MWLRELVDPEFTNPHELLNGLGTHPDGYLIKQWSDVNAQSVQEIQHMLEQNSRPIVARLSYDHALLRTDSAQDLQNFYQFLNEYFDVYVSRRDNLFDYALCWAIRRCTDRAPEHQINNVHSPADRARLYEQQQFTVDTDLIPIQAEKYRDYLAWCHQWFPDAVPVHYQDLEADIDSVLQQHFPAVSSFQSTHGMSIAEFTLTGYALSCCGFDTHQVSADRVSKWHEIDAVLQELCARQILLDTIPIKSSTMHDKMQKIRNFTQCVDAYNHWAKSSALATRPVDSHWLTQQAARDQQRYDMS